MNIWLTVNAAIDMFYLDFIYEGNAIIGQHNGEETNGEETNVKKLMVKKLMVKKLMVKKLTVLLNICILINYIHLVVK